MQFTLFGVIWILLLIVAFFLKDLRFIVALTLFSMVLQCNNVIVLDETAVGVQVFAVLVALIRFVLLPRRNGSFEKPMKSLFAAPVLLLVYMVFISLVVHGELDQKLIRILMIAVYALFAFIIYRKQLTQGIDEQWLEKTIDTITVIVLVVGLLQYLACAGVSFLRPILTTWIFNDTENGNVIFHSKPSYAAMYSTFMEPSYFAAFMVGLFSVISMREKATGKNLILLVAIGSAILLSRSSTGFGGLAIVLAIQAVRFFGKRKIVRIVLPLAMIAVFGIVVFNYELLDKVLFSKDESASYATRTTWNLWAWEDFLEQPLFGVGIGQSRASSLFYTLLAELGILGFLLHARIIWKNAKLLFSRKSSYLIAGFSFAVLSIWICQVIACPDMNLSPFWMMLFMVALASNLRGNKNELMGADMT